ncbi:MAG: glycosyltransferase [Gemmatimonadota bacterium]|nr:glycosyltransferase [Gemmatimonadota bacterium]
MSGSVWAGQDVSVVIPTLGGQSLARTIDQLNRGTLLPAEILVCIPEEHRHRVVNLAHSNVRVIGTSVRGQVAQRIEGFKSARNEYVLQLDDDVVVDPHCLERLVAAVAATDGNYSVAAALRHADTDESVYARYAKPSLGKFYYVLLNGARGYAPGTVTAAGTEIGVDPACSNRTLYDVEWLPGGCVLHSRRNLVLQNYYPHAGKAYCEDLYQSRRLSEMGVGMRIASDAIAWIEDPRAESIPFARWLTDLRGDYRARRHYLKETSGSAWRMHAYYALRFLSRVGKLVFSPAR